MLLTVGCGLAVYMVRPATGMIVSASELATDVVSYSGVVYASGQNRVCCTPGWHGSKLQRAA